MITTAITYFGSTVTGINSGCVNFVLECELINAAIALGNLLLKQLQTLYASHRVIRARYNYDTCYKNLVNFIKLVQFILKLRVSFYYQHQ